MERTKYYVSVQSDSILAEQGAAAYELEIVANDQELEELELLFKHKANTEKRNFIRAPIPGIPYHIDDENDQYDDSLVAIYQKLHALGTEETKLHVEEMNILQPTYSQDGIRLGARKNTP